MKKILVLMIMILLLGGIGFWYKFTYLSDEIPYLEVMEEKAEVTGYYIYGTALNIEGAIENIDTNYNDIDLVLYNGEFISYDIEVEKGDGSLEFDFNDYINEGIFLEDIARGTYYLFIRVTYINEDGEEIYNYYVLDNNTDYTEDTYYTLSNTNLKIVINSLNDYDTMMFSVTDNTDSDIYDIVIDPGHGGY